MTSRERMAKALSFQEPDRVPITDSPGGNCGPLVRRASPRHHRRQYWLRAVSFGSDTTPMFPIRSRETMSM